MEAIISNTDITSIESNNSIKKRITYMDIAKGITILLVIIGHNKINPSLKSFIFSFHMPLFFIISGYFFKQLDNKNLIHKNIKRLIIPYIFTGGLVLFLMAIKITIHSEWGNLFNTLKNELFSILWGAGFSNSIKGLGKVGATWFLLALFWSNLFFNFSLKQKRPIFWIILIGYIGYKTSKLLWLPFSIQPGMVAVLFMYVGYIFKQKDLFNKKLDKSLLIVIFLLWVFCIFKAGSTNMVSNTYKSGLLNIISAICGTYFIIKFSQLIEKKLGTTSHILENLGKSSLTILCIHLLELNCISWYRTKAFLNSFINSPFLYIVFLLIIKISFILLIVFIFKKLPIIKNIFWPSNSFHLKKQ